MKKSTMRVVLGLAAAGLGLLVLASAPVLGVSVSQETGLALILAGVAAAL